ncbi:uncharacterized protein B0H64DRAFT_379334 [Chaetomium fimeti]|uniref:DUF7580 domain-containing protein n=1 Tax=Chaetomium fimeti TaxID=1854472 RepID=A0AAE0HNL2_9PEZI|nr:hypothetical protein B0H64DRAFT_379334 [Chaetomium fimeti]
MSGIEAIGIALGSVSVLISLLQSYGKGASVFRVWRNYRPAIWELTLGLQVEESKLRNVCHTLLVGRVPHSDLADMMRDPGGDLWKQESLRQNMRALLGTSELDNLKVFEYILELNSNAIAEIRSAIDAQNNGEASKLTRARFTLNNARLLELLSVVRAAVADLDTLARQSKEREPEHRARSQTILFSELRDISSSFYRALRGNFRCSCSHKIGLELQSHSADIIPTDDSDKIMKDLSFQVAISSRSTRHGDQANPTAVLNWQGIIVKAWTPPTTPTKGPTVAPVKTDTKKGIFPLRLSRSTTPTTSTAVGTNITSTNLLPADPPPDTARSAAYSNCHGKLDLCKKLSETQKQATSDIYGILVDYHPQPSRTMRYSISPAPCIEESRAWSVVSLRDILEQTNRVPPLYLRDRVRLAVTISSSVLQLHGTPWLPHILTSRHIFFLQTNDALTGTTYCRPVLLRHFPGGEAQPPEAGPTIDGGYRYNPTLLSLGCLLIEVLLGQPLHSPQASTASRPDTGVNLLSDRDAAEGLLPEVKRMSESCYTAVVNCIDIEGELHRSWCGLEDWDLCHEVYSRVVVLLEEEAKR